MRIECIHGYFRFFETNVGQISRFMSLFGLEIERNGDHFTFSDLVDAPNYSILGGTFLGIPTIKTFEGPPWEVMRANRLVYDFNIGLIRPIDTVIQPVELEDAGNYYLTTGMILPGSITDDGSRVTDYAAFYSGDRASFKYSEITYE